MRKKRKKTPKKLDVLYVESYLKNILLDARTSLPMYGLADYTKDLETLSKRLRFEGVSFATKTLPSLFEEFLLYFETGISSFSCFKTNKKSLPRFLQALTRTVVDKTFAASRVRAFDVLYTFCVSFSKIKGPYPKTVLFDQYRKFVLIDEQLGELSFTDDDPILRTARAYMADFINTIDIDDGNFIPRPGPGATNQPTQKHERYEPRMLYKQIDDVLNFSEWFTPHPWDFVERARFYFDLYNNKEKIAVEPSSRFKFVPKKVGKARGICIEENEVQFLQQAFRRGIQTAIKRSQLGPYMQFDNQSCNALLALESSKHRSMCTIDMSDASDRVSRTLVNYLFQDNPELCKAIMALSTRVITPPKELAGLPILRTNKFAPMGSALCFPVMTLVHYMLLRAIILHSRGTTCLTDALKSIYVYGDDIIIPTTYYERVVNILPKYGMKINTNKSFANSYFRESCGIHALHGHDVTPVYVKHTPFHTSFEAVTSCLANYTDLIRKRLYKTARFLRDELTKRQAFLLPQVSATSPLPGFYNPDLPVDFSELKIQLHNRKCKSRWNSDLQQYEFFTPTLTTRQESFTIKEATCSLLRWFGVQSRESDKTWSPTSKLYLRRRWVLESAL